MILGIIFAILTLLSCLSNLLKNVIVGRCENRIIFFLEGRVGKKNRVLLGLICVLLIWIHNFTRYQKQWKCSETTTVENSKFSDRTVFMSGQTVQIQISLSRVYTLPLYPHLFDHYCKSTLFKFYDND